MEDSGSTVGMGEAREHGFGFVHGTTLFNQALVADLEPGRQLQHDDSPNVVDQACQKSFGPPVAIGDRGELICDLGRIEGVVPQFAQALTIKERAEAMPRARFSAPFRSRDA